MCVNERINSALQLRAVDHSTSSNRVLLGDSVEWTAEDFERKFGLDERSDKCAELGLLVDVGLDVLLEKGSALEVPLGVFRFWFRHKGDIPTVFESLDDLVGIKISFE